MNSVISRKLTTSSRLTSPRRRKGQERKLVRAKDIDGGKQYRETLNSEAFEEEAAAGGGPSDAMRVPGKK